MADKANIYKKTERLKTVNRGRDHPYFVADQLPETWAEKRKTNNFFKQLNSKLPQAQQHKVDIKKGTLIINDTPFSPEVRAPTVVQLCGLTPERKRVLRDLEILQKGRKDVDDSVFAGFAAEAYSTQMIQKMYEAMFLRVPDATHIICAYRLPGVDIATNQGFVDNGEHGAGRALLSMLIKAKATNTVVFVTRHYGGRHIGAQRFQLIEKVAQVALAELTAIQERNRRPLNPQELQQLNDDIRAQEEQAQLQWEMQRAHPWNTETEDTDPSQSLQSSPTQ